MEGLVTVEQALSKGRWQLKYLPMIATFGCIGLGFFLSLNGICGGWIYPVSFILGFVLGWLVWSYFELFYFKKVLQVSAAVCFSHSRWPCYNFSQVVQPTKFVLFLSF